MYIVPASIKYEDRTAVVIVTFSDLYSFYDLRSDGTSQNETNRTKIQ